MPTAIPTPGDTIKPQTGNGTAPKRTPEDPRKVALRELYTAQQRLIDAEDALAEARAVLAEKTKAFEATRGKRA